MSTLVFKIPNISCGHCAHTIKSELLEKPGITTAEVDVTAKRVSVTFDERITREDIISALKEIDYAPSEVE